MLNITPFPSDQQMNRLLNHHVESVNIRADQLKIDDDYQRKLSDDHINAIARDFNPMAFGVLLVSQREDGTMYVIDGQHRWRALERLESLDEVVPCHVYRGLTRQEEAFIFEMGAKRLAMAPVDRFRAKLFYRDPQSVAIAEVLRKYGYQIAHHDGIKAAGSVEKVYKTYGTQRLDELFDLIRHSVGQDPLYVPSGTLITGVNAFLSRYDGRYSRDRLIRTISNLGGDNITRKASALRELTNEMADSCAGRVILTQYNKDLRTNRLPDWDSVAQQAIGNRTRNRNLDGDV